ncbi:Spy/CpxP family protein refolding chaperone [Caenimonas terrae]|uniref:Spy/CpxP family protein refolding chaperone n=1 Tax=Caenimonas terrae TaxID=696074 RepID=A0ABW0NBT5_9BURK
MKRALLAVAAGLVLGASACGQPYGGPGMMGGNWGPGGYPMMGPGMMGGYGPGGYGPGPGWGMGPGMMGGGFGPGAGMMQGYGPGGCSAAVSDLSAEQREKIAAIQREFTPKQFALMQQMQEIGWRSMDGPAGRFDEQAARRNYDAMADLRKQMFVNSLEAQKRVDAVLTPQQREQLHRGGPPGR